MAPTMQTESVSLKKKRKSCTCPSKRTILGYSLSLKALKASHNSRHLFTDDRWQQHESNEPGDGTWASKYEKGSRKSNTKLQLLSSIWLARNYEKSEKSKTLLRSRYKKFGVSGCTSGLLLFDVYIKGLSQNFIGLLQSSRESGATGICSKTRPSLRNTKQNWKVSNHYFLVFTVSIFLLENMNE